MNSTMWKIALRTLARDKTYALISVDAFGRPCVSDQRLTTTIGIPRAHPVRALRYK